MKTRFRVLPALLPTLLLLLLMAAPIAAYASDASSSNSFAAGVSSWLSAGSSGESESLEPESSDSDLQDEELVAQSTSEETEVLYRLYNPNSGEHFYTANDNERIRLKSKGWKYEGIGWTAPKSSDAPVYRMYNKNAGDHHYTMNANERDKLKKAGWRYEGIGWYSVDTDQPRVALYREYNPNATAGSHNFTLKASEHTNVVKHGWKAEGLGWFAVPTQSQLANGWIQESGKWQYRNNGVPVANDWVVTKVPPPCATKVGNQRYWIGSDSTLANNRLVDPQSTVDSNAGYFAYAEPGGTIVRGKYDTRKGYVYVADDNGQLATGDGWVVTSKYDGQKERYYFDANMHAAKTGQLRVDGKLYWGTSEGYVARNTYLEIGSKWYKANNSGVLEVDKVTKRLISRAQGYSSSSRYLIMVDIDDPRVVVLQGRRNNWKVKYVWDCCTGRPSSPTVTGVFQIGSRGHSFGEDHGYSCYYWTQIYGPYLFHTRLYDPGTHRLQDSRMGKRVSAGCVRLYDDAALWIYNNAPSGTTVVCMA